MTDLLATDPRKGALRRVLGDAGLSRGRTVLAVLTGSAALGSAVGLAAVAAWMIARAAGMPSPADLAIAAVVVRFFGIGRGLFRYLERLTSHDVALRGAVSLRVRVYERLAHAPASHVLPLTRGQVMARIGADVDAIADAVVRGLIPMAVAVVVSGVSVGIAAFMVPLAGVVLAVCLVIAGVGAAALTLRSARAAAALAVTADARVTESALSALEAAAEHRVWGTTASAEAALAEADAASAHAHEAIARPAALAAAVQALAAGLALIGSIAVAVTAAASGAIGPTTAAVVALLPLAAFEAVGAVPAAMQQLFRSARAAERIEELAPPTDAPPADPVENDAAPRASAVLEARDLSAAWPRMTATVPVTLRVAPGEVLAVVGRSGIGKTTLLATLGGALSPAAGEALIDGVPVSEDDLGTVVAITSEDAHVFGTTVLENLRVARGGVTEDEALEALSVVGLRDWAVALPDGLGTVLGSGGGTVSGGERRRLLLARALLAPHPIHLIDEPGEHLDHAGRKALRAALARLSGEGRSVVIVTHDLTLLDAADRTISLDAVSSDA
ncbi:thiol reductant ABC exporter subunit CydC [Demequina muriae]|uniref:Thiol reductant ABC exporter subunit CydC n=1 Tax=Demequina muriae TaxID=3051664 RepID=A0ABT8GJB6_9MICO|nr:thiol reductant ABC exporter subunit CydC [Demequina sp. EGI L300058]MDN4481339.1 thiol reductant ABC exporter subunit CydC [Demequina sp. EGI L300058]